MKAIEMSRLSKTYNAKSGAVRALDGVNVTISKGEFVSIVGQSGSGKSTLMNIMGCLDTADAGVYELNGRDVSQISARELAGIRNREIGFVFQSFNLIPGLSAVENVELPLAYRGLRGRARRELAMLALERLGLGDRARHRPSQLSGGQQQRVAIARAIAAKPVLLLADEPTGNLDYAAGQAVMEILGKLSAEGVTIVLITHDRHVAASAQRTLTLAGGRLT